MRDVGSQLAEYFEAATERIDAEDVLTQARVAEQLRLRPTRRSHSAWAAALGFAGVLVLVGGALVVGRLLHDPAAVSQPVGTPVADAGSGWGWWLVVGGAVVALLVGVLVSRRLRRATKEVEMQTLDEKQQEAIEPQTPRRSRSRWFIGLSILLVLAGAIAAWAVIEANQKSDIEIATELADEWIAGWNASDVEAIVAVFSEGGREEGLAAAEANAISVNDVVRTSDLWATDADRTFRFAAELTLVGLRFGGEWEIELDGDLASRITATERGWGIPREGPSN